MEDSRLPMPNSFSYHADCHLEEGEIISCGIRTARSNTLVSKIPGIPMEMPEAGVVLIMRYD